MMNNVERGRDVNASLRGRIRLTRIGHLTTFVS